MILKEFAVDPKLFGSSINCQLILSLFGASEGKLISRFPKKWKKMAYEEAKRTADGDIELAKITEIISRMDHTKLFSAGRSAFDEGQAWVDRALSEHINNPFSGIITEESGRKGLICFSEMDLSSEPFVRARQMQVKRSAPEMVEAIKLIFLSGSDYKLIDPHFAPVPRYVRPLIAFLEAIGSRSTPLDRVTVECHLAREGSRDAEETNTRNNFTRLLSGRIPDGITVSFHFHPRNKMHDRWVLSTWAGIQFGHGLDEGREPELVNISLLDEEMRQRHWNEYLESSS